MAGGNDDEVISVLQDTCSEWMTTFAPNLTTTSDFLLLMRWRLRCKTVYEYPKLKCHCAFTNENESVMVDHILRCPKVKGITAVHRHDGIIQAMENVFQAFSLIVTLEPQFYTYAGGRYRPDITIHTEPLSISTDIVVSEDPDDAAKQKLDKHKQAVANAGHVFIPFAIHTNGALHASARQLISEIRKHLGQSTGTIFERRMTKAVSEAWALGSAAMVRSAIHQHVASSISS